MGARHCRRYPRAMDPEFPLITPDWPAPAGVRAASTTRAGGVSVPPFHHLNLGLRSGDDPEAVTENRRRVENNLDLPEAPRWLAQVHGTEVAAAEAVTPDRTEADAVCTDRPGVVCAVLTADCLPVLLCDRAGTAVAAAHAGWRGLAAGVLENAVAAMGRPGQELMAWLGPAIGPEAFEVGDEVRAAFMTADPGAESAFRPSPAGRWLADLYTLARRRLAACGVQQVHGGGLCTYTDQERFHSYRRDGASGRMASLIWME